MGRVTAVASFRESGSTPISNRNIGRGLPALHCGALMRNLAMSRSRLIGLVLSGLAATAVVTGAAQRPPARPPRAGGTSSATRVISPVALVSWVARYGADGGQTLDLIVCGAVLPAGSQRGLGVGRRAAATVTRITRRFVMADWNCSWSFKRRHGPRRFRGSGSSCGTTTSCSWTKLTVQADRRSSALCGSILNCQRRTTATR